MQRARKKVWSLTGFVGVGKEVAKGGADLRGVGCFRPIRVRQTTGLSGSWTGENPVYVLEQVRTRHDALQLGVYLGREIFPNTLRDRPVYLGQLRIEKADLGGARINLSVLPKLGLQYRSPHPVEVQYLRGNPSVLGLRCGAVCEGRGKLLLSTHLIFC